MSENVKSLTLKGLYWNAIDRFGNQIVTTVVGVVIARLLNPSDFAVLAVLVVFSTIATSIVDSGLATSLVRSKVLDDRDYSSMFVFNLVVSIAIYLMLYFGATWIEKFYNIPNLALYARILFLQIVIQALGKVHYVKLLKEAKFNITAKVNVISVVFSGVIAIGMAMNNQGVLTLVVQPISAVLCSTLLYWIWGTWKVDFGFYWGTLRKHLAFSISFMFSNLIGKMISPLYYNFVGKNFLPEQTGYYYQANRWGETPNLLISSIIQGTTLSTLSSIQDDYARYLNACRKTFSTLGFVLFPISFMMISMAESGFVFVLTEKYLSAVPYFQVLCLAGVFISLTDVNVNFINIKGKSKQSLILEIVKVGLAIVILVFTFRHGILAIILGQLAMRVLAYVLASFLGARIYGYHIGLQLKDLAHSFGLALIAGIVSYVPFYFQLFDSSLMYLFVQGVLFVSVYLLLSHFSKHMIWLDLLKMIKSKI